MTHKIYIHLDFQSSLELSTELSENIVDEHIVFDFSQIRRVEPFALLMASSQIRRFQDRHQDKRIEYVGCHNHQGCSYARHMGFFDAFGIENNNLHRGMAAGKSYIPIEILNCQSIVDAAYDRGIEIGDQVEEKCRKMAAVLAGTEKGDLYDYLTYSFRELLRNVVEHSESSQVGYCAQYWPTKNRVELAIIDRGIGLKKSLENNPHIDPNDDKKAINYALMPAVSGKAYKGAPKQYGNWANSGFGLYMTNRICRNGGSFFIASGDTGMLLTDVGEGKRYYNCNFTGTAARMIIKTQNIGQLNKSLERYRDEGYEIQKQYRELVRLDPSAASLMLTEDFSKTAIERLLSVFGKK